MSAVRRIVAGVLAGLVLQSTALAADDPVCAPIKSILEAAPRGWRALKTEEYETLFDSWRSRQTIPGFDRCWIDDVEPRFWCMNLAPSAEVAGKVAATQADTIERCFPGVPTEQAIHTGDNNIKHLIQDWNLPMSRRVRLVHRKPIVGSGPNSVFLYIY